MIRRMPNADLANRTPKKPATTILKSIIHLHDAKLVVIALGPHINTVVIGPQLFAINELMAVLKRKAFQRCVIAIRSK